MPLRDDPAPVRTATGDTLDVELRTFGLAPADDPDQWLPVFRAADRAAPLGRLGPFEVLGEVGRGGQGVVYRARIPGRTGDVALKRMLAGPLADARARRRFEREAEAAARLDHPAIVRILESGIVDDHVLLVMEWVDGAPVTDWADDDGGGRRRPLRELLAMFTRICDAVGHAHQRGVIHRDLKPANILVTGTTPKLLDFGVAKLHPALDPSPGAVERTTCTAQFIGTPAYAAPEQLRGGDADVRADVYALGVILFRMLTGRLPYDLRGPLVETLRTICETPPARASALQPGIPRDLDAILLKTLQKDAAQRYTSVDAFVADIHRFLAGRPVSAHPPSLAYRARKWIARRQVTAALAGLAIVSLVSGAAAVTVLAVRLAAEQRAVSAASRNEAAARRVAERVAAFLRDTLASARPGRGGGDARVLDMLRAAEARAATELADEPAVAAEVYFTIGQTYRTLWLWHDALPALERAATLYRGLDRATREPLARTLTLIGTCLSNLADPRCVDVQREALAIRAAERTGDDPLVAESLMRLGYALYRGRRDPHATEAESALRDALAMYRRLYPRPHRDVASCLHNIGYMRWQQRRLPEAVAIYEEALAILRALHNPADPYFIECLNGYASLLEHAGRTADAVAAWEELRPLIKEHFGQDWLYEPTVRLAAARLALDDCAAAAELYAEAARLAAARAAATRPERAAGIIAAAESLVATLQRTQAGDVEESPAVDEWPPELDAIAAGLARLRAARGR